MGLRNKYWRREGVNNDCRRRRKEVKLEKGREDGRKFLLL